MYRNPRELRICADQHGTGAYREVWPRSYVLRPLRVAQVPARVPTGRESRPVHPGINRITVTVCIARQSVPDLDPERSDVGQHIPAKHIYARQSTTGGQTHRVIGHGLSARHLTSDNAKVSMQS